MHFLTDGYRLVGGQLKLDGGASSSIRSTAGATTRIDAELTGNGGVFFNDFGTVILTGANSYQGNTRVDGGTMLGNRSEEHTSELQSLMRNSYAVFCLKK